MKTYFSYICVIFKAYFEISNPYHPKMDSPIGRVYSRRWEGLSLKFLISTFVNQFFFSNVEH